jgi:kynurenine formamidase
MILSLELNNLVYKINHDEPLDISIPLRFNGEQPNAYDVAFAASKPCQAGSLVGDTRRGGSCNFEEYVFIPHCNGTHTESVGHITRERISIQQSLKDCFIPSTLVSIEPENALDSSETYAVNLADEDKLITKTNLENALKNSNENFLEGLIIRTLPNDESKKRRVYMNNPPPFFSTEAMQFIAEKRVKHLLVDMPSIDRAFDEGKLSNHRIFWNVEQGEFELNAASYPSKTITEMIYAPDEIPDSAYLLNLQIAPFVADASPSRPILFKIDGN